MVLLLCIRCYSNLNIRQRYPTASDGKPMNAEGLGIRGNGKEPEMKTICRPGTDGKIIIMQLRAKRGESLHRDDDVPRFHHKPKLNPPNGHHHLSAMTFEEIHLLRTTFFGPPPDPLDDEMLS